MNEELMKKAYEDLDGVWPKGYTALIVSTYRNPVWGCGKYDNYSLGKDVFEQSRSNPLTWKWVGTNAEFEEYRKSLKGRAMNEELIKKVYEHYNGAWPSRADVILTTAEGWNGSERLVGKFTEGWYDEGILMHNLSSFLSDYDDKVCEPWIDEKDSWIIACTEDQFKTYGDGLKKEWAPDVGEECLVSIGESNFNKCLVMGFFGDLAWVNLHLYDGDGVFNGSCVSLHKSDLKFLPFKSDREKLFEECVNALKNEPQCDKVNPHHMDAIEWLIDAGFIDAPSS